MVALGSTNATAGRVALGLLVAEGRYHTNGCFVACAKQGREARDWGLAVGAISPCRSSTPKGAAHSNQGWRHGIGGRRRREERERIRGSAR